MHCRGRPGRARRGGGAATTRMRDPRAGRPGARGARAWVALLAAVLTACGGSHAAVAGAGTCGARAYPAPDPHRPRYRLVVHIPARGDVTGVVHVRFTPDLPTRRLVFRLWPNGLLQAREGASLVPGRVRVRGYGVVIHRP